MNDFTKEELIEIKIALDDKMKNLKYDYDELITKIQSMIDNYSDLECPSCGRKVISES